MSVFRSPASKISAALLRGPMANNRRQGFRLIRMKALRPVWGGVLRVPRDRMLGAYNEARASVRVCVERMLVLLWSSVRERRLCSSYMCGALGYIFYFEKHTGLYLRESPSPPGLTSRG